jgi:hypothetical protein
MRTRKGIRTRRRESSLKMALMRCGGNVADMAQVLIRRRAHPASLHPSVIQIVHKDALKKASDALPYAHFSTAVARMTNMQVTVLGDVKLSPAERNLLAHGEKFVSTPAPISKSEWLDNVDKAIRKLVMPFAVKHFLYRQSKDPRHANFGRDWTRESVLPVYYVKGASDFNPIRYLEDQISRAVGFSAQAMRDIFTDTVVRAKESLLRLMPRVDKRKHARLLRSNLSPDERNAITSLNRNKDIVVMKADKNMGILVLPTPMAKSAVVEHLLDSTTYSEPIDDLPREAIEESLEEFLRVGLCYNPPIPSIDQLYSFLTSKLQEGKPGLFYGLAKIHKLTVEQLKAGVCPPTRPIGAAHSLVTTPAAKVIDRVLQPAMKLLKSYIPDSIEMIQLLEAHRYPRDAIIWTADVKALYPNVPTDDPAIERVISKTRELTDDAARHHVLNYSLVQQLLRWSLSNHYVVGPDNAIRRQLTGLGMGIAFAPAYSNLWFASYEELIVERPDIAANLPFYRRYIDDLFGVWTGSRERLEAFLQEMSSFYPTIKLEGIQIAMPGEEVHFLDLNIRLDLQRTSSDGKAAVRIRTFQKEQNIYQYLPQTSFHPEKTLAKWPQGESIRYARTNTYKEDYLRIMEQFNKRLQARGYPAHIVKQLYTMPGKMFEDRQALLEIKRKPPVDPSNDIIIGENFLPVGTPPNPIVFVTRWSPSWHCNRATKALVKDVLVKAFEELADKVPGTLGMSRAAFPTPRALIAFCNSPSLHRELVRARRINKDAPIAVQNPPPATIVPAAPTPVPPHSLIPNGTQSSSTLTQHSQ